MNRYLIELLLASEDGIMNSTKTLLAAGFFSEEEIYEEIDANILEDIRVHRFPTFDCIKMEKVYCMDIVKEELQKVQVGYSSLLNSISNGFSGLIVKNAADNILFNYNPLLDIWQFPEKIFFLDIFTNGKEQKMYTNITREIHTIIATDFGIIESAASASYNMYVSKPTIKDILDGVECSDDKFIIPVLYDLSMTNMLKAIVKIDVLIGTNKLNVKPLYITQNDAKNIMIHDIIIDGKGIHLLNSKIAEYTVCLK